MKRERRVDLSSCTFSFLHFLLFFFVAAFISTHYSTHRQALGATLIGPSNRQVSLLPLKGASLVSPKTFPSSLKPSCFLRATLPSFLLWICCIFQKIHECSKEGTLISAFVPRSFVHVLRLFALEFIGLPVRRRWKS